MSNGCKAPGFLKYKRKEQKKEEDAATKVVPMLSMQPEQFLLENQMITTYQLLIGQPQFVRLEK